MAAVVIASVVFAFSHFGKPSPSNVRSVAVLPFTNTSGDTALDYLGDGIGDELRSGLTSTFPELSIKARSSSQRFRGDHIDVHDAGAKLGVGVVLEGTVRQSNGRLRVTADLVNVADASSLWSGSLEASADSLGVLQDALIHAVSTAFHARLALAGPDDGAGVRPRGTKNMAAYTLFLQARAASDRFDFVTSIALLRKALALDPTFARAEGLLAMSYQSATLLGVGSVDSGLSLARVSAARALALDSTTVEAYIAQSFILGGEMRFGEALKPFEKALAIDPTNADVLGNYGFALGQAGRVPEAVAALRRARERDPLSAVLIGVLSYQLELSRQFDEAITNVKQAIALAPTNVLGHQGLGFLYVFTGKPDSAVFAFQKAFALDSVIYGRNNLVFGYAAAGRWADARRERALVDKASGGNSPNYHRMIAHLAFSEFDEAMTSLERGVANHEALFSNVSIPCDPIYDPLKASPRFGRLMKTIGADACPAAGVWPISKPR
jgi:serine/threonine-protein kinase